MRNYIHIFLIIIAISISCNSFAQVPQKMSYQSVIRNTEGNLVVNTAIGIQISILKDTPTGQAVYVETMTNTTNENGLLSIEIGGGTPVTGNFSQIDWSTGTYFVKTETDPSGGTNYTIVGTGQLLSVPYALFSGRSTNLGKSTIYLTDDITDEEAVAQIEEEAGPNTENVIIEATTLLTTVDLSKIKSLLTLRISGNQNLVSLNFSNLKKIYKDVNIDNNPLLTALDFPVLEKSTSGIFSVIDNAALTNISFPSLTYILTASIERNTVLSTINFNVLVKSNSGINVSNNNISSIVFPSLVNSSLSIFESNLTSIDLPLLTAGAITLYCPLISLNTPMISNCYISITNSQLTSLNFPTLSSSGAIELQQNNLLTEVLLPNLTNIEANININSNPLLNTISIPLLTSINPGNYNYYYFFSANNNALPESQINYLLNILTNVNPNLGKKINLSNQNPPAPPTGQGLLDKTTLINNGFSVITD